MCRFIESIAFQKGDAPLLSLHQERIQRTLEAHHSEVKVSIEPLLEMLETRDELYKLRVIYDLDGKVEWTFLPYEQRVHNGFTLIEAPEISYGFKKADRSEINKYLERDTEPIFTQEGLLTDASYANVLFLEKEQWWTPSDFLLQGVQRAHLLREGRIKEKRIHKDDLSSFSHFALINAMIPMERMKVYPTELLT